MLGSIGEKPKASALKNKTAIKFFEPFVEEISVQYGIVQLH